MFDLVGRSLGQYEILEEIGHGGMANVYSAVQRSIGRKVAVKVLPAHFLQDRSFLERFSREVQVVARLHHPHILQVYDYGEQDGVPYIVMGYLEGGSLADLIRRSEGGLALDEVVWLVRQIAGALDYAHREGIIHRDFKPSNVLLDTEGNAYLSDFGIAKVTEHTAQLTGSGYVGTPAYMAPEMTGQAELTPLVDIYALGATLYEMLTGHHPYSAQTPVGVLMAHVSQPVPDVRERRPDLPPAVQGIIERAMAKDPRDRYQSAGVLADDLEMALLEQQSAETTPYAGQTLAATGPETEAGTLPKAWPEPPVETAYVGPQPADDVHPARRSVLPIIALGGLVGIVILALGLFAFWPRGGERDGVGGEMAVAPTVEVEEERPTATREAPPTKVAPADVPTPTVITPAPSITNHFDGPVPEGALSRIGKGRISQMAFSPDGQMLALATSMGVYVYRADYFELSWVGAAESWTRSVDWSPDGTKLVSGSDDGKVVIWDAPTGRRMRVLDGHPAGVNSVAWSPDGSTLASGSDDMEIGLWDSATGDLLRTLAGHRERVTSVAWSPDGATLASGSYDGSVIVWDAASGEPLRTLEGHTYGVNSVAWSPDGSLLASGSGDGEVIVWDAAAGTWLRTLKGHTGDVTSVAWSPDGAKLASGDSDARVILWDAETGDQLRTLENADSVESVAWSPDSAILASVTQDWHANATLWDAATGEALRELGGHMDGIQEMIWSANSAKLYTWLLDGWVSAWSVPRSQHSGVGAGPWEQVRSMAASPDGYDVAFGTYDAIVILMNTDTRGKLPMRENQTASVESLAWSPDSSTLASGSADGVVFLWDKMDRERLRTLEGHTDSVVALDWSPDGRMLAAGLADGTVVIWNPATGARLRILQGHADEIRSVAWSPDSSMLAASYHDGTAVIWSMTGGQLRTLSEQISSANISANLAWSMDGTMLASGLADGTTLVWDVGTGEVLRTLGGHTDVVTSVAFSPDGTMLAAGSLDGTALVWAVRDDEG